MESLRYLNKGINSNERQLFSNYWKEQIHVNGQLINYYQNQTALSGVNVLYGEEPSAGFAPPKQMLSLIHI